MYICFRGTHGRLANIAKCAVLFKYWIDKKNKLVEEFCAKVNDTVK